MSGLARGEETDSIVLHDEDGTAFAFHPLRVGVSDARGVAHAYRAAGRLFFHGRDLLFLAPEHDPGGATPFEVGTCRRIEPVAYKLFLGALHAHIQRASDAGSAR